MKSVISSGEGLNLQPKKSPELISQAKQSNDNSKSTDNTDISGLTVPGGKSELQLVHATRDRVRLRATDSGLKSRLDTISQQLQQQDGVGKVYANQQTGSLVIAFDQNKLVQSQIFGLLQQLGISKTLTSSSEASKTDLFAAWKSVNFWKEQGHEFIPLIAGLLVTRALSIHGFAAVPVYLIAAGAIRQVMSHLELEALVSDASESSEEIERKSKEESVAVDEINDLAAQSVKAACSVVHATPGRVRLKVPRLVEEWVYAQQLEKLLKADATIANVRVNRDAASLVITYHPSAIPVSHWVEFMQLADEATVPTDLTAVTTQQSSREQNSPVEVPSASTARSGQPTPRSS